jgi:NitT/TauT family transport system substrate-binding protein
MTKRSGVSRRVVLAGALAAGAAGLAKPALAQVRRKVQIAFGVPTMDSADGAFFSSIPIGAGFYADEGLDVEILPLNGAGAAMNMLAAGQVDFTTHGGAGVLAGVGQGVPLKAFIVQVPNSFYAIGVDAEKGVQKVEDLKGKTIGVPALGGSPLVMLKAALGNLGWDANKDVTYQAVGVGMPALDALRRGRVDALMAWDAPFATFQANGAQLRLFNPEPWPQIGFTHTTNASLSIIQKDPGLVAAMGRALARALVFMAAAPQPELSKLHFKVYPSARAPGLSDAMIDKIESMRMAARRPNMRFEQRVFSRVEKIGDETEARIAKGRDLLAAAGEIKEALPVDRYFTRQFIDDMNKIDVDALIARAKSFKV